MLSRHRKSVNFSECIRLLLRPFRSFFYMRERILRISAAPHEVALGFSIGIFLAFSPFFGLHIVFAVFFSWILRGNFAAAIIGTVFSNPLTFLPIIMADYKIGYLFLSFFRDINEISLSQVRTMLGSLTFSEVWLVFGNTWDLIMMPVILGSVLLGFIFSGLSYMGIYRTTARFQQKRYQKMMKKMHLQQDGSGDAL
ncbi:hypothetical protein BAnh1_04330 [Bartonella australis AUST/NH1]|uniref:DUF2062 domain-containing protein n=1 Tax=Bartonella australis (strain Aust/NH1) TaxID=1094489 RepID=M1N320_BARAA|nr:DUF2062 domain-containing protein [Bartonella australis]AGF74314.1 hypothetical protein BAnh1_04330 [Bartonella australis AUST/NH1]